MFTLAISWLGTCNLPWFMDLKFQVPMQYCCFTAPNFTFTTRHVYNWASFPFLPSHFILSGTISNCPLLFPSSTLDTFWLEGFIFWSFLFAFSCCSWQGLVCHSLLQWTTFCLNSPLWPFHLGWACTVWLIASLNYTSPFALTGLWSMKRRLRIVSCKTIISSLPLRKLTVIP